MRSSSCWHSTPHQSGRQRIVWGAWREVDGAVVEKRRWVVGAVSLWLFSQNRNFAANATLNKHRKASSEASICSQPILANHALVDHRPHSPS